VRLRFSILDFPTAVCPLPDRSARGGMKRENRPATPRCHTTCNGTEISGFVVTFVVIWSV